MPLLRYLRVSLALLLVSCGEDAVVLYEEQAGEFYSRPFPSNQRLYKDGSLDLRGFPRETGQLGIYVQTMDHAIQGAGPQAAVYFRFNAPVDPTSLPQSARATTDSSATVFVVDITPGSPTFGQRAPVVSSFHEEGGRFIGNNWLAMRPVPGFPLRPRTTYAAIVTTGLRVASGGGVRPTQRFLDVLQHDEAFVLLRDWLARFFKESYVAGATVFTTGDPTALLPKLREATYRTQGPVPQNLRFIRDHDGLSHIYHGSFQSPNFQQGEPPYLDAGGSIVQATGLGGELLPAVQRTESLRFALSIPNAQMPESGWPIILYAHGTGGDFETFLREGVDLRAAFVERVGGPPARMAVIGIDQVLHGPRDPSRSPVELTFFNLKNIAAARDNPSQGAVDNFQLLRLVRSMNILEAPATNRPIRFDERHIYFVGHSQGGLTGPLFVAYEPAVRSAVFSGAGAGLVLSLLNKTEPVDVASLVESILGEAATPDHPLLNLLQSYFEAADPGNYGHLYFREPPAGLTPKSIFQSLGVTDHYTPVPNIKAFALSMGVQPVAPVLTSIEELSLTGQRVAVPPVRGNVAEGRATGVLLQYREQVGRDGHFVLFDRTAAKQDWSRFLAGDVTSGLSHLP